MMNYHFLNSKKFIYILFACLFSIGLGYIFILPVFEGFDENAHYSRLRETFSSPSAAFKKESYLDNEIVNYEGPLPYLNGKPPYDHLKSYNNFFNNKNLADNYASQYKKNYFNKPFVPSSEVNWQIQHPPLYYFLFSVPLNFINNISLVNQIIILRTLSYLVALVGLFFGILAISKKGENHSERPIACMKAGLLIYPIIFPMFFLEFARIGNDSLCIFFIGLLAFIIFSWDRSNIKKYDLFNLGLVLALGLVTKAFFIPITAAILLTLLIYLLELKDKSAKIFLYRNLYLILLPLILISGSWYLYKFVFIGDPGLGFDALQLSQQGGLIKGLKDHFDILLFFRGTIVPIVTFIWAGSWSLARMPIISYAPLMLGFLYLVLEIAFKKKIEIKKNFFLVTILSFLFMYLGLCWHVLIQAALSAPASSPGWYLHILAPFIFPILGAIFFDLFDNKFKKILCLSFFLYALIFHLIAIWSHFALFGGCAIKSDAKNFFFNGNLLCLDQFSTILKRLEIISYPNFSLIFFFIGFSCLIYLIFTSFYFRASYKKLTK